LVEGARDAVQDLMRGTQEEFGKADIKISWMGYLLGARSEEKQATVESGVTIYACAPPNPSNTT
jgi:hypothetical protein